VVADFKLLSGLDPAEAGGNALNSLKIEKTCRYDKKEMGLYAVYGLNIVWDMQPYVSVCA